MFYLLIIKYFIHLFLNIFLIIITVKKAIN